MIYRQGKKFLSFALKQYFRRITIKGEVRETGPLLVVANHQNMALDPLLVVHSFKRDLHFLAKSTLFQGGVISAALKACHLIPVYRRMDNPRDSSKNREMFRAVVDLLSRGEGVVIFPEGVSLGVRKLEELKTGAARIALQSEDAKQFGLGLQIQPVGITYSDLDLFRASVTVQCGEPFFITDFRGQYERDAVGAVHALTNAIEAALKQVTVEIQSRDHEALIQKIAKVYAAANTPLDDHARFSLIADRVERYAGKFHDQRIILEQKIDAYLDSARFFRLSGESPLSLDRPEIVLLRAPLTIFGALCHLIPYEVTRIVATKYSTEQGVRGTLNFGFGVLFYFSWYVLVLILLWLLSGSIVSAVTAVLVIGICGLVANRDLDRLKILLFSHLWPGKKKPLEMVRMMHMELLSELERFRTMDEAS